MFVPSAVRLFISSCWPEAGTPVTITMVAMLMLAPAVAGYQCGKVGRRIMPDGYLPVDMEGLPTGHGVITVTWVLSAPSSPPLLF
jgi:uncharacterized membrane protein (DUF485 family)